MKKLQQLTEFLTRYQDRPFETGVNDCALFISDWVLELTGKDFSEPFRGQYTSDLGSARLIKKLGFTDLSDLVSSTLDEHASRRSAPLLAQRGDVAWVKNRDEYLCGIVVGDGVVVLGENGLITLSILQVEKAWCIEVDV